MHKKLLITLLFLWPFCTWAADPQVLLEDAVSLIGTGPDCNWNNQVIGQKLRDIRLNYPQTRQALDATALLAFYLTQIPGDFSDETHALCDEVTSKAPKSWQSWIANSAKIAAWGLREGEDQKTLDAALTALAQTNGSELCGNPNDILIIKPLMVSMRINIRPRLSW